MVLDLRWGLTSRETDRLTVGCNITLNLLVPSTDDCSVMCETAHEHVEIWVRRNVADLGIEIPIRDLPYIKHRN
jgi:hypothetical protein